MIQKVISVTFQNRDTSFPSEAPAALTDSFASQKQAMWRAGFLQKLKSFPEELLDLPFTVQCVRLIRNNLHFCIQMKDSCKHSDGFFAIFS